VAVSPFEPVTRGQLLNAFDERARAGNVVQGQIVVQRAEVEAPIDLRMREDGFQLRAEVELAVAPMKIERLDSQAVARNDQALVAFRPDRQRKHSVEALKAIGVPLEKSLENYFGIAVGFEPVAARLQLRAQLAVVVDFAIEDQHGVPVAAE